MGRESTRFRTRNRFVGEGRTCPRTSLHRDRCQANGVVNEARVCGGKPLQSAIYVTDTGSGQFQDEGVGARFDDGEAVLLEDSAGGGIAGHDFGMERTI